MQVPAEEPGATVARRPSRQLGSPAFDWYDVQRHDAMLRGQATQLASMGNDARAEVILIDEELTRSVRRAFYHVYNTLGPGFLESVYRRALEYELRRRGIAVEAEAPINVFYEDIQVGHFRADLLVEGRVVVEIKATRALVGEDVSQLLNCLVGTRLEVGVLLHFGAKPVYKRLVKSRLLRRESENEA